MARLYIDGATHTGNYRVDCDCDANWRGRGERIGAVNFSPMMAVASCVVHMKHCHKGDSMSISFSKRFEAWILHHWERGALRVESEHGEVPYGIAQR